MNDHQGMANRVRELVEESETVQRLGIEVLRSAGTESGLTIRARRDGRVLTVARGAGWWEEPTERLAETLTQDLVADVLSPPAAEEPVDRGALSARTEPTRADGAAGVPRPRDAALS